MLHLAKALVRQGIITPIFHRGWIASPTGIIQNGGISTEARKSEPVDRHLNKKLKETAETVIVGGGIVGLSIAYHLARAGQKDVMLLEKSELTAGSTWHAAGLTTLYNPGINLKQIHYHSINMFSQIEKETGQEVGFHRPGSIRLATNQDRLDEMKYQMSRNGWQKNPQKLLTPDEIHELCPIMNMDEVIAGLYNPYDGHIDPYSLSQAIAIGARKWGAEIYMPAEVTGLKPRADGGWDVTTAHGTINARRVVQASGFWARETTKFCGLEAPICPVEHQYVVTSSIPEVKALKTEIPVLRHLEGSFYLRQEKDGLLCGPYESKETMKLCDNWMRDQVPPGFGKELFASDTDRILPHLLTLMKLLPCFATAEIATVVCGPITYSPDLMPLIGPTLLPNMWLAVGLGYGIIHAGGVGKFMADWIMKDEPPYELLECDPLRYGKWTDLEFTFAKCRESYGMNNSIGWPQEERFAGRPTCRVSGAHNLLVERRANMEFHSGWEQPGWFAAPGTKPEYKPSFRRTNWHAAMDREYSLVMSNVGILDLTPFAKFKVTGPDARHFLDHIATNTIPKPGRITIAEILAPSGRVYAEMTITALADDNFFVITGSGSELHDLRWLLQLIRKDNLKVNIENVTDEMGALTIAGPNSRQLLSRITDSDINKWPFLSAREIKVAGVDVLALRISFTGELGWELYCRQEDLGKLYTAFLENGQDLGVGDFGTKAMNTMRLEKGFRTWGLEMNMDTTPLEAGLDPFIRMNKDFIGKEALITQQRDGLKKNLVMLTVDSPDADPQGNETIWCCNKVVGNTTSGCYSPNLGTALAFGYIPPFLNLPGTEVDVELLGNLCKGTVLPGPPMETQPTRDRKKK